ncbi:MAG: ABC transporter permease [Candidatus Bathyarchaeia archaeon]
MGFRSYATRRFLNTVIVLIITLTLQFFIFRVMPGNPIMHFVNPNLPLEARQALLQMWGLERPLHEQFLTYLYNLFSGRLGISFISQRYVSDEILERLPNTILLMGSSTILSIALGIGLGVSAGAHRGARRDVATVTVRLLTQGLPVFFLGLLLLLTFAYYLPIATGGLINFPVAGTISRPPPEGLLSYILDMLWHLTLPMLTLVVIGFGGYALVVRNLMIEVLTQDYILMAKAKGLEPRSIVYRHGLRSILPPLTTMVGLSLPGIVGGAVITETIFSWHGIGRYLYEAILQSDYPVMQGTFFLLSFVTILANLAVDLMYGMMDPRIRY